MQLDLIFVISNEVVLVLFLPISLRLSVFEVINLDFCGRDYLIDESVREHLSQLLDRHNLLLLLSFPLPLDGSVPRPCLYDHLFGHKEPLNLLRFHVNFHSYLRLLSYKIHQLITLLDRIVLLQNIFFPVKFRILLLLEQEVHSFHNIQNLIVNYHPVLILVLLSHLGLKVVVHLVIA